MSYNINKLLIFMIRIVVKLLSLMKKYVKLSHVMSLLAVLFIVRQLFFTGKGLRAETPHIKNKYKDKVLISVIIPTYEFDDSKLERAIRSVELQKPLPPLVKFTLTSEIIVINDGSSEIHFRDFARRCQEKSPINADEREDGYECKAGIHLIRFISNPQNDVNGARNFGIMRARGKWIQPLDPDDELMPYYFSEVLIALNERSPALTLHNPGKFNVIMPGMADYRGKKFGWQPTGDTSLLREENVFHCCGLVLKSIYDSGIMYDKMMIYGWEDWDFWIKLDAQIGITSLMVDKPLYKYNVGEDIKEKGATHQSSFCLKNYQVCKSYLRLNNPCLYDLPVMISSYAVIFDHLQNTENVKNWKLVLREAKNDNVFAQLLVSMKAAKSLPSSMPLFFSYHDSQCLSDVNMCSKMLNHVDQLAEAQSRNHDMSIFHIILTKVSSNILWKQMLMHVVVAILDFNPKSTLLVHSNVKKDDVFENKFLMNFGDRIMFLPLECHIHIAEKSNITEVGNFMKRFGKGRPNYYSHFTDYLRYLLLYTFGGIYLDTDILLRHSVTHIRNSATREDEQFVNGAFLAFDRHSPVMLYCLNHIPAVYEAFIWNTIGPNLLTQASKIKHNEFANWELNVLNREAFYDINWDSIGGLITATHSDSEYNRRDGVNLGYHLWGKVFYAQKDPVVSTSLLGHALRRTCHPDIMSCVSVV